jgi:hypothetical protein
MGFSSIIIRRMTFEDRTMTYGTYASTDAATGGTVVTGLRRIELFIPVPQGSAVSHLAVLNGTLPIDSGNAVIVTNSNGIGTWIAIGF